MQEHRVFRPTRNAPPDSGRAIRNARMERPDSLRISCVHPDCEKSPQSEYEFPLPLCRQHLIKTLMAAVETVRTAKRAYGEANAEKKLPFGARMRIPTGNVVYYIRFGDRIKIGTTGNLTGRLMTLPHDELLATEPGGIELEKQRHRQFAADLVAGREWFRPANSCEP